MLGVTIAALAFWSLWPVAAPQPVSRFVVALPPDQQFLPGPGNLLALSPDGSRLAFVASIGGGPQQLYLRDLDAVEPRPIPRTENAINPFFSPDGQWIGFSAEGRLKKVSVTGGAALTLCDAPLFRGATWGPNDTIVFAPSATSGLLQVPAAGGRPQEFTTLKEGEVSHRWPQFLPNGKAVIFTVQLAGRPADEWDIAVQRPDSTERQVLVRGGTYPRYVPTGHLIYYREGTIMAVSFDPDRLEVTGTPAPVLEGVASSGSSGQFSFSDSGSLVYVPGPPATVERSLIWVDRKGAEQPLEAPLRFYDTPRLSSDGRRIAVRITAENTDIWVYELERRTLSRFTFDEGTDETPVWTPDGRWIAFASSQGGASRLLRKPADGSGEVEELAAVEEHSHAASWSPDGRVLVLETGDFAQAGNLWLLPMEGDLSSREAGSRQAPALGSPRLAQRGTGSVQAGEGRKPIPLLQTPFNERGARFSPDGRWLAYSSDESGRMEVYVQPYPGPGGKRQIPPEGGGEPVWARSGRELFYRNGDEMVAVEITTQPTFSAGTPQVLFEGQYPRVNYWMANYDVSPDGQRFLMLKEKEQPQAAATQIHVVLNWFEELKRRVPTR